MQGEPNYSGQIAYEIDKEVQRIIKEQYERCKQILIEHQDQLKLIAKTLLTEETLVAEQIRSLFYDGKMPEVDYDSAKIVNKDDTDFSDGKYGKSYDEIREEQLEQGDKDEDTNKDASEKIVHLSQMTQHTNKHQILINHIIQVIQTSLIIDNNDINLSPSAYELLRKETFDFLTKRN